MGRRKRESTYEVWRGGLKRFSHMLKIEFQTSQQCAEFRVVKIGICARFAFSPIPSAQSVALIYTVATANRTPFKRVSETHHQILVKSERVWLSSLFVVVATSCNSSLRAFHHTFFEMSDFASEREREFTGGNQKTSNLIDKILIIIWE